MLETQLVVRCPTWLRALVDDDARRSGCTPSQSVRRHLAHRLGTDPEPLSDMERARETLRVFGQAVKARRGDTRLRALGEELGISFGYLSLVERGELLLPEKDHAKLEKWMQS